MIWIEHVRDATPEEIKNAQEAATSIGKKRKITHLYCISGQEEFQGVRCKFFSGGGYRREIVACR